MLAEPTKQDFSRTLVTVMKDEAPYLIDWICYHLAIGFTHFIILTNDCSDGTETICRKLSKLGIVTHKNNPAPHPKGPQKTGYQRMRKLDAVERATWLMALDVDEYLRIDIGDGTLNALFEASPHHTSAYSFVWQLFGNNDVVEILDPPIYQQILKSQHPLQSRPYETMPIKTLFKRDSFERIGTHRPLQRINVDPNFLWIDADGVPMKPYYDRRHWRSYENGLGFGTILGRINHYALRSLDGFMVKWARGFVHPTAPTVRGKGTPLDYWKLFNWNQYLEPHELKQQQRANAYRSHIMRFENLEKKNREGLQWHQNRASTLKSEHRETYQALQNMGASKIDEPMPDFSQYGSPMSLSQTHIPRKRLQDKALRFSVLDQNLIQGHYDQIAQST